MKLCSDCHEVKSKTEFYKAYKDSLARRCKDCAKARVKVYREKLKVRCKPSPEIERLQEEELRLELAWGKARGEKAQKIREEYTMVQEQLTEALREER